MGTGRRDHPHQSLPSDSSPGWEGTEAVAAQFTNQQPRAGGKTCHVVPLPGRGHHPKLLTAPKAQLLSCLAPGDRQTRESKSSASFAPHGTAQKCPSGPDPPGAIQWLRPLTACRAATPAPQTCPIQAHSTRRCKKVGWLRSLIWNSTLGAVGDQNSPRPGQGCDLEPQTLTYRRRFRRRFRMDSPCGEARSVCWSGGSEGPSGAGTGLVYGPPWMKRLGSKASLMWGAVGCVWGDPEADLCPIQEEDRRGW